MTESPVVKTCKMCCMEIAAEAKKCPYCQHWQNKLSMLVFHPGFNGLLMLVPLIGLIALVPLLLNSVLDPGEDFQQYSDQIKVIDSDVRFGECDGGPTVAVVGRMTNQSDVDWRDLDFQVEFFDGDGVTVDAGQELKYFYSLPSGDEIAFKVSFLREFPESQYVGHKIRVISAKDARSRVP